MRRSRRATVTSIGAQVAPAMNQSPVESPPRRQLGGAPAEWSFEALTLLARGEEIPVGVRVTRVGAEAPHFILAVRDSGWCGR
jgi:hypothetical protein